MSKFTNDSDSDFEEVSNLLECSICLEMCQIPIQQCKNGHNVCSSHIQRLEGCPVCRVPYSNGSVRNLLAEKLVLKKQKKLELKEQQKLAKEKLIRVTTANLSSTLTTATNTRSQTVRCNFSGSGCQFRGSQLLTTRHELTCHLRPLSCCLETDRCNNAQIPFHNYINHLKTHHKVKSVRGSSFLQKYFVNASGKLIRNGSSSLTIMESLGQVFLVTAKEKDGEIYIWISIHGHPPEGLKFNSKIELQNPCSDDKREKEEDEEENVKDFNFSGPIKATTRMNLDEMLRLRLTPYMWSMDEDEVENSLETTAFAKEKYRKKFWSVRVSIIRAISTLTPQRSQGHFSNTSTLNPVAIRNAEETLFTSPRRTIDSMPMPPRQSNVSERNSLTTVYRTPSSAGLLPPPSRYTTVPSSIQTGATEIGNRNTVVYSGPGLTSSRLAPSALIRQSPGSDYSQRIRELLLDTTDIIGSRRIPLGNTGQATPAIPTQNPMSDFARAFYASGQIGLEGILHSESDSDAESSRTSPITSARRLISYSPSNIDNATSVGPRLPRRRPPPHTSALHPRSLQSAHEHSSVSERPSLVTLQSSNSRRKSNDSGCCIQ